MKDCQISVVIPCHNDGKYLQAAIRSVLDQQGSFGRPEIVVVDDHSSDSHTLEVLAQWEIVGSGVRVVRNTGCPGPAGARNFGISVAAGEWIAFLDADDVWLPGSLSKRWDVVQMYPDAEFISADYVFWDPDGRRAPRGFYQSHPVWGKVLDETFASGKPIGLKRPVNQFLRSILAWTGTVMAKRARLLDVGCFDERLRGPEDDHLWVRLARVTDLYFVPEVLALYRQRKDSITNVEQPPGRNGIAAYTLLKEDPHFRPYKHMIRKKLAFYFGQNVYYHRLRGETWWAVRSAAGALLCAPSEVRNYKNFLAAVVGRR